MSRERGTVSDCDVATRTNPSNSDFVIPGHRAAVNPESIHPVNLRLDGFRARAVVCPGMTALRHFAKLVIEQGRETGSAPPAEVAI